MPLLPRLTHACTRLHSRLYTRPPPCAPLTPPPDAPHLPPPSLSLPKAGRKLEHVRAGGSVGAQRLYELGQQMQLVEDAAAACTARAEEVTCVQEYSEAVRAEREANGPLFV